MQGATLARGRAVVVVATRGGRQLLVVTAAGVVRVHFLSVRPGIAAEHVWDCLRDKASPIIHFT